MQRAGTMQRLEGRCGGHGWRRMRCVGTWQGLDGRLPPSAVCDALGPCNDRGGGLPPERRMRRPMTERCGCRGATPYATRWDDAAREQAEGASYATACDNATRERAGGLPPVHRMRRAGTWHCGNRPRVRRMRGVGTVRLESNSQLPPRDAELGEQKRRVGATPPHPPSIQAAAPPPLRARGRRAKRRVRLYGKLTPRRLLWWFLLSFSRTCQTSETEAGEEMEGAGCADGVSDCLQGLAGAERPLSTTSPTSLVASPL
jgi:hypothetical protein